MSLRLILHAGTPKTGSTSLQNFLHRKRLQLADQGFYYPEPEICSAPAESANVSGKPKHQWIVTDLMATTAGALEEHLRMSLSRAPANTHTAFLSTEGIYNHWWDFSTAGKGALENISRKHHLHVWLWLRRPIEFATSFYIQNIKNPPGFMRCYGQQWSLDEMIEDPWFARHLKYWDFISDVRELIGRERVRLFQYRKTAVADLLQAMELCSAEVVEPTDHQTLSASGVQSLLELNHHGLARPERAEALADIVRQDAQLGEAWKPFVPSRSAREQIRALSAESVERVRQEYGLDLRDPPF